MLTTGLLSIHVDLVIGADTGPIGLDVFARGVISTYIGVAAVVMVC